MKKTKESSDQFVVAALYQFTTLNDYELLRSKFTDVMKSNDIKGTILLANEGINGTICGPRKGMDAFLKFLKQDERFNGLEYKESFSNKQIFYRTKCRLKKEIVTLGVDGVNPNEIKGEYVKPKDWNNLIADPNVILIDTRNDYEYKIGTFKNAVNPNTKSFRELPEFVEKNLKHADKKNQKIAMFCTGGIRCEKSTSFLKSQGFDKVYHLKGGILKYLEEVKEPESLWDGECFVFDNRIAVKHDLKQGKYDICRGCRMPLNKKELKSKLYEVGVSCDYCFNETTEEQKSRYRARHKQVLLSEEKGEELFGQDFKQKKLEKQIKKQQKVAHAQLKDKLNKNKKQKQNQEELEEEFEFVEQ